MIDTLKLVKRLEAANMSTEQAEALAEGLADSLTESYITREFFDARRAEDRVFIETRFTTQKGETDLLKWMIGFNLVMTMAILWRVFAHG